ncbi:MAG: type II toxin-antitoxin system Phd/YefM family antitoxin [Gemmatimonadota bacterium]|nr:type II toxin-antitoxin system Phd/YefM family antitoxin [Gemmatimonadota bacterium]
MRFIQIKDLRPSEIWEQLADEREMVITAQGKPIAILSSVSDDSWEETLAAFRRVRAVQAVDELQKQSVENGLDKMDLEEVNREIQAVRESDIL